MGDSRSEIADDYKEYCSLCRSLNIKPLYSSQDFYKHWRELKQKNCVNDITIYNSNFTYRITYTSYNCNNV